jgi:outer membrane protein
MRGSSCRDEDTLLKNIHCGRRRNAALGGRAVLLGIGLTVALAIPFSMVAAQGTTPAGTMGPPVQLVQPQGPAQAAPPVTVTLQDALDRARKNDAQFLSAVTDARNAHEDSTQAKAALLPSINYTMQYLGTQGDGGLIPDGRFVTNDGVHVYRVWGVLRQDLSPSTFMATGYHRAAAAEALANAKAEIARRGLTLAVTQNFYGLIVAQRKYATAQQALDQARRFFEITQDAERVGQGPHSDTIKAEIQYQLQQRAFEEARLSMEDARLNLAVMLFPQLNENFTAVDDLDSAQPLPPFGDVQRMAEKENPDLRVAVEALREANLDVTAAKTAFFPTLAVETDYGIEANCFGLHCTRAAFALPVSQGGAGVVPNLGYFLTAVMNVPVWDWGTLRSKLHQSQYRRQQAQVQLSQTQRQMLRNLYAFYNEATTARSAVETNRQTADLAVESLRLTNLRFQAGTSTALEVVDAENTLTQARNAYNDAQARYRVALANLQTLTGSF